MTNRLGFSVFLGLAATIALFYLMQALIAVHQKAISQIPVTRIINFVRVKEPMIVTPTKTKHVKPPPARREPPPVTPHFNPRMVKSTGISFPGERLTTKPGPKSKGFTDGAPMGLVKVQPIYPQRALARGLSGWVIVQFTVTTQGSVASPFIVQNCAWIKTAGTGADCHDSPNAIFDAAAIQAVKKFKYRPRVVDGRPMETGALQNKISFELDTTQ